MKEQGVIISISEHESIEGKNGTVVASHHPPADAPAGPSSLHRRLTSRALAITR